MWIHEGWANYSEVLFVEYMWGKKDAIKYLNTGKDKVKNEFPVISPQGVFSTPPPDQYKKGALFLNTVRSVLDNDHAMVFTAARLLPALQVPDNHDHRHDRLLRSAHRPALAADF